MSYVPIFLCDWYRAHLIESGHDLFDGMDAIDETGETGKVLPWLLSSLKTHYLFLKPSFHVPCPLPPFFPPVEMFSSHSQMLPFVISSREAPTLWYQVAWSPDANLMTAHCTTWVSYLTSLRVNLTNYKRISNTDLI